MKLLISYASRGAIKLNSQDVLKIVKGNLCAINIPLAMFAGASSS